MLYIEVTNVVSEIEEQEVNEIKVKFHCQNTQIYVVRSVKLYNEVGEQLSRASKTSLDTIYAKIYDGKVISFCFKMDKCYLLDGAKFEIMLTCHNDGKNIKFNFILKNKKWVKE